MKTIAKVLTVYFLLTLSNGDTSLTNERKDYIIYMGNGKETGIPNADHHHTLLSTAIGNEKLAMEHVIRSYGRSINAFAARLLPHEAERLKKIQGVVSVFPSTVRKVVTARSWDFVGLPLSAKRNITVESDLIVGLLDTGIDTANPIFNDKGFGPPPAKWKGSCDKGDNFTGCNKVIASNIMSEYVGYLDANKVIGARYYSNGASPPYEVVTPADFEGHGTHTASTAAGLAMAGASFYGLGKGTVRGGVPSARVAMYKTCWALSCTDIDMLAAFDDAIADGVDILSISIAANIVQTYYTDVLAIGAFHAMRKGILTVCAGGNAGPSYGAVKNNAPWIFTVAATSLDRNFVTEVTLGDGQKIPVKGKIIQCDFLDPGSAEIAISAIKGVGIIFSESSDEVKDHNSPMPIPTTVVTSKQAMIINHYINTTKYPTAVIEKTKIVKQSAPFVGSFSSRGPNPNSNTILKPDIAAPGVNILAGYTRLLSPSELSSHIEPGGEPLSRPYVTHFSHFGSTATDVVEDGPFGGPFAYGAGQMSPVTAVDPGLIYDLGEPDYISFLCNEGLSGSLLGMIVGTGPVKCPNYSKPNYNMNYPSMQYSGHANSTNPTINVVFTRTVTNVGHAKSVYKAIVKRVDKGLSVRVVPKTLKFIKVGEKKSYKVLVKTNGTSVPFWSGLLEWNDSKHRVRSQIVIVDERKLNPSTQLEVDIYGS
ncbi:hypothetical protein Sjap_001218 [Stephania japonica]|uniref:Uncharacterized protein n=1 Tax=Stephania japonica TaxID=461633 RepID=A0AAP0KL28_9MAGN